MKVYKGLDEIPSIKNAVITVGTFDGVHIGHQKILKRLNQSAEEVNGESVLITFDPHPRLVVQTEPNIRLLSSLNEKIRLLRATGLNHLSIVRFSREFSNQEASNYISDFLVKHYQPKKIIIGYNHKFGKDRSGDIKLLHELKASYNYEVEEIQKQEIEALDISSTKVRNNLKDGNIEQANKLLGYAYGLEGLVIKGDQLGRTIGYPTANIELADRFKLIPKDGIYAVHVIIGDRKFDGMLYIGSRPTVNGTKRNIEVNILNFDESIYGEHIRLECLAFIRPDQKFDSMDLMIDQMHNDKEKTMNILKQFSLD